MLASGGYNWTVVPVERRKAVSYTHLEDIDNTVRLELAYDQNTFSLEAVSINYDYPSNILYSCCLLYTSAPTYRVNRNRWALMHGAGNDIHSPAGLPAGFNEYYCYHYLLGGSVRCVHDQ